VLFYYQYWICSILHCFYLFIKLYHYKAYPKYEYPHAHERYAEIAKYLGLNSSTAMEGVNSIIDAIHNLMLEIDTPTSLKEAGVKKEDLDRTMDYMANNAFADQCTGTNPRMPLVEELKEIYLEAWEGK